MIDLAFNSFSFGALWKVIIGLNLRNHLEIGQKNLLLTIFSFSGLCQKPRRRKLLGGNC